MNLSCRPCCHASSSRASSTPPGAEPALFTRMSIRPKCRAAPRTKFSASSRRVGAAVRRSEDYRFVTGRGRYVADIVAPDHCHAVVVRSAVAHARVARIDVAPALRIPGVLAVLTFADLGHLGTPIPIRIAPLPGFERYLQWPLARDRVRYVGEPLALVRSEE